jgi:hypothetical protein
MNRWQRIAAMPAGVSIGCAVAAAAALVVWPAAVPPAFVHDAFHGPFIVNGVLAFPAPPGRGAYGAAYGPGSFAVLGLLSFLTGRSAEGVMIANAIVAALATIPVAALAARLSGRPRAGLYASLLWAASPLVARLARSEDAHVVGVAFALTGLWWIDVAATERSRAALWVGVLATAAAVFTRQTFIQLAPIAALLLIERTRRAAPGERLPWSSVIAACAALGGCLLARAAATAGSSDGQEGLIGLAVVARHPEWLPGYLAAHPLLSIPRLPVVVPLLLIAGAIDLRRRAQARVTIAVAWCGLFLLMLPSSFPSAGVRWSFRLPSYALSIVIAGAGAAWLQDAWERRRGRPLGAAAGTALVIAALALGAAGTAIRELRAPSAEFIEYRYLRDTIARLPRGVTLIGNAEEGPAWRLPGELAARAGIPVVRPEQLPAIPAPGATYVMPEGLGCQARDAFELAGAVRAAAHQLPARAEVERLFAIVLDPRTDYGLKAVPHPVGPRPSCARILAASVPYGPPGPTVALDDSPPTAIFGARALTLRFVEWRGAHSQP